MKYLIAIAAVVSLVAAMPASGQAISPVFPGAQWQRTSPEEMGMDSRALAQLVEFGSNVQMDSIVVTRHGRLVMEAYYAPFRPGMKHRINSATKAVVGTLAGIAISEGKIRDAHAPMLELFADRRVAAVDDRKKAITLQHLLDNNSGIQWDEPLGDDIPRSAIEMGRTRDWSQYVLDRPMAASPGEAFNYSSGSTHLVSTLIARTTGMPTQKYADEKLFKPLGITDWRWREDPQGVATGGWGLYLTTQDMARFGHLYAQRGEWNGRQVVPRPWVEKVFNGKIDMFPGRAWRYADYWWTLPQRRAYLAVGFLRQMIVVMPESGVVAAVTGRAFYPIENLIDHLERAAVSNAPLPANADASALLAQKVALVTDEPAQPVPPLPPIAQQISGKTYTLARAPWGWRSVTLRFDSGVPQADIERADGRAMRLPLGMDGRFAVAQSPEGLTGVKARWMAGDVLQIVARVPEEVIATRYEMKFEGTQVEIMEFPVIGPPRKVTGEQR